MVKYSSRVNIKPRKSKKQVKKMTTQDQPSEIILSSKKDNIDVGGVISSGGAIKKEKIATVLKKAAPIVKKLIPKIKTAVQKKYGAALPVGGVIATGGILNPDDIDNLPWQAMIHTLGAMDQPTYHMLQGLAAAHLGQTHPYAAPLKAALGGSFIHPKNISRLATKDILKANSPQILSTSLHNEWLDMMNGKDVGGGLFSSLKMLAKRGVAGAKSALSAVSKGAQSAVKALSSGAKTAGMIGKSLSNAINQGIEIANVLQPAIGALHPATGELITKGVTTAKDLQAQVKRGTALATQVAEGLEPILGSINAPRVGDLIPAQEVQFAS